MSLNGLSTTARAMIDEQGSAGTLRKFGAAGTLTGTEACKFVPVSESTTPRDGALVRIEDIFVLVSPTGLSGEPTPEDRFIRAAAPSLEYQIVKVGSESDPDGTPGYYSLQLRP